MSAAADPIEIRSVRRDDAVELADMLNAIIAVGGTTALETPYTADALDGAYLSGPKVVSCIVAVDRATGQLMGFQTLGRYSDNPLDVIDIGTYVRIGAKQRGIGSRMFAETRRRASALGYMQIDATIRGDNAGGLTFYGRLGFADHAVTPAVPLADGRLVDRVHKRFDLTSPIHQVSSDEALPSAAVSA